MAVWILCRMVDVVAVAVLVLVIECVIAVVTCLRIFCLFFSYLAMERDFCVCCLLVICVWITVHVGMWSVSGGDMVPAVMLCSVAVVSVTSMSVAVRVWTGS